MRLLPLLLLVAVAGCDTAGDSLIARYNGPEITEADAAVVDPLGTRGWDATRVETRAGRTVLLTRSALCGDECNRTTTLVFEGDGDLPESVEVTVTERELMPERRTETRVSVAQVEVQDWGPRVYSGVVHPADQDGAGSEPIVFWADRVAVAVE